MIRIDDKTQNNSESASVIEVENLEVAYGERVVLHDLNLKIPRGSVTCICGGSGCGKSTFLRAILGLIPSRRGSVRILGEDILSLEGEKRSRFLSRIGFMYQNAALLNSLSLRDNLRIPFIAHTRLDRAIIDELVNHKLGQVQLSFAGELLPGELSGGMLKRAGFARAIALEPELVLSDEPSAGLDPVTAADLDALMLSLKNELGISLVVVTHDLDSIRRIADRIIMLDQGIVRFIGTFSEASTSPDLMVSRFFSRSSNAVSAAANNLWQSMQGKS